MQNGETGPTWYPVWLFASRLSSSMPQAAGRLAADMPVVFAPINDRRPGQRMLDHALSNPEMSGHGTFASMMRATGALLLLLLHARAWEPTRGQGYSFSYANRGALARAKRVPVVRSREVLTELLVARPVENWRASP